MPTVTTYGTASPVQEAPKEPLKTPMAILGIGEGDQRAWSNLSQLDDHYISGDLQILRSKSNIIDRIIVTLFRNHYRKADASYNTEILIQKYCVPISESPLSEERKAALENHSLNNLTVDHLSGIMRAVYAMQTRWFRNNPTEAAAMKTCLDTVEDMDCVLSGRKKSERSPTTPTTPSSAASLKKSPASPKGSPTPPPAASPGRRSDTSTLTTVTPHRDSTASSDSELSTHDVARMDLPVFLAMGPLDSRPSDNEIRSWLGGYDRGVIEVVVRQVASMEPRPEMSKDDWNIRIKELAKDRIRDLVQPLIRDKIANLTQGLPESVKELVSAYETALLNDILSREGSSRESADLVGLDTSLLTYTAVLRMKILNNSIFKLLETRMRIYEGKVKDIADKQTEINSLKDQISSSKDRASIIDSRLKYLGRLKESIDMLTEEIRGKTKELEKLKATPFLSRDEYEAEIKRKETSLHALQMQESLIRTRKDYPEEAKKMLRAAINAEAQDLAHFHDILFAYDDEAFKDFQYHLSILPKALKEKKEALTKLQVDYTAFENNGSGSEAELLAERAYLSIAIATLEDTKGDRVREKNDLFGKLAFPAFRD